MRARLLPVSLLALLVAAPVVRAATDSGWREVRTDHVVLMTDLGEEDARRAALSVERTRAALLATAWPGAKLGQPGRIEVMVLARDLDFEHFFGRNIGGVFLHGDAPLAILYGAPDRWETRRTLALEETTSVLKHELAHHLAAYFFRRQPRWFSEGLAQFLETIRVSDDGRTAVMGAINLDALSKYNAHRTVTVADVLAWGGRRDAISASGTDALYGLSWLLVHWLYNVHPREFAQYQTLLAKGIEPDKAWKIAFGSLSLDGIDRDLNQYARHGEYGEFPATLPATETDLRQRPLGAADVHVVRARVALAAAGVLGEAPARTAEVRQELTAALEADPGHVGALRLAATMGPSGERTALARRAIAAHPEDGFAWLMLAEALRDGPEAGPERERALRKVVELLPEHPAAFNELAWLYVQEGKAREALPLALTAVNLAPWNAYYLDTLAAALAGVGRCSEASGAQARAIDRLPERSNSKLHATFVQRLQDIQAHCVPPAAQP